MTDEERVRMRRYSTLLYISKGDTSILTELEKADFSKLMKQWLLDEGLATQAEVNEL